MLQDFLNNSLQVLQNVPLDETGIAEAGVKYERIMTELPKVHNIFLNFMLKLMFIIDFFVGCPSRCLNF